MRWAAKLDLAAGILLGIALGLACAYLVIFVIGGGGDTSSISTSTPDRAEEQPMKSERADRAAPSQPSQRR